MFRLLKMAPLIYAAWRWYRGRQVPSVAGTTASTVRTRRR